MALKIRQIREMAVQEAEEKLLEMRADLAKEKALVASHTKQENPGKIRALRRTVAKILTIVNEKKHSANEKIKNRGKSK
ncbi:MAG: 50S ribosomal protein L29 [Candidatus Diapherotrites archaeon]|uniref:Large ribosomal subunit protein uL29 n=1 Tax=Candidatus Iainarchaeum sp. TaxID=3101447 RepID=A0A8T4KVF0_9ARCH|nr:50S ribosomal protein L29 [Candidatus Diapherotrites archaeon]